MYSDDMHASPPADASRDDLSSKQRILRTAVDEFSRNGYAATRIDAIAARAEVNKQLLYYYFGSKADLYDAALSEMVRFFRPSDEALASLTFPEYFDLLATNAFSDSTAVWRRMLAWEGMEYGRDGDTEIHLEAERRASYEAQLSLIEDARRDGILPEDVDARALMLFLIFAAVLPDALPQLTRMVTGLESDDPELRGRIRASLRALLMPARGHTE
jgi:AcrR family transcriptional regulator